MPKPCRSLELLHPRFDEAGELLAGFIDFAEEHSLESAAVDIALLRGHLAELQGDTEAACRWYEAGERADANSPLSAAQLRVRHGALLRQLGDPRGAVRPLREAHETLVRLGAVPFLERCDAELAACGLRAGEGADRDVLSLTPREAAVAHLVAEGLSNREVATRLYVSTKAVEYHLGNIYAKLGITSRRHLATRLRHKLP
ncbi:MAG: LuxR C-terminal-related transcriptional regulator [Actinomycetota bacterium]|nr:LuxR C-terminal-related transcriptional regulator [Actinomycetota bacterium]